MTNNPQQTDYLDEIFLEPIEESDSSESSKEAYVMVLDNNAVVSIIAPLPLVDNSPDAMAATCKLDDSILKRFEDQQRAIKRIEEQERELKLMYRK